MGRRDVWIRSLADPRAWGRGLRIGIPVGLLQAAVHQGEAWLRFAVDAQVLVKTAFSPAIAFLLVWVGAAGALATKAQEITTHER